MPNKMTLLPPGISGSSATLGDIYGVVGGVRPSGYSMPVACAQPARYYILLAAPVQSPADSPSGREIEGYVERYLSSNFDLVCEATKPVGVSSSRLARAARMNPWEAKNRRRIRLIGKKYEDNLTPQETIELDRLKREVSAHMEIVAPRSGEVLDEQAARLEKLKLKKAEARKGKIG